MTKEEEEEEERKKEEKTKKNNEEFGDPGSEYEWSSGVDSAGNPIKKEGEESSEESEWYYDEDRIAYERGEYNPIPDLLNKNPITDKDYNELDEDQDRVKMMHGVSQVLG